MRTVKRQLIYDIRGRELILSLLRDTEQHFKYPVSAILKVLPRQEKCWLIAKRILMPVNASAVHSGALKKDNFRTRPTTPKSAGVSGQFCLRDHKVELLVMECLKEL